MMNNYKKILWYFETDYTVLFFLTVSSVSISNHQRSFL